MDDIHIRPARDFDAGPMATLLATMGDGSADPARVRDWMAADDSWHLAEDSSGRLTGLQWIGPGPDLPRKTCDIATFVPEGPLALRSGTALFDATRRTARRRGYAWIRAAVPRGNTGGVDYYRSRGFETTGGVTGSVVTLYRL